MIKTLVTHASVAAVAAALTFTVAHQATPEPTAHHRAPLYAIEEGTVPPPVYGALLADFAGAVNDNSDSIIYVPVGTVADVPGGTVTILATGPKVCEDWTTTGRECNGGEYTR